MTMPNDVDQAECAGSRALRGARLANATIADARAIGEGRARPDVMTVTTASEIVGVPPTAIRQAKRVLKRGAPELIAAVEQGAVTLAMADQILSLVPVKAEQPAAMARVLEVNRGRLMPIAASTILSGIDERARETTWRRAPKSKHFGRAVQMMETALEVMQMHITGAVDDPGRAQFADALRRVRADMGGLIRQLDKGRVIHLVKEASDGEEE